MPFLTCDTTVCAGSRTQAKAAGSNGTAAAPSRGVLILPGLANNSADYGDLSQHLHDKGMSTRVVEVSVSRGQAERSAFVACPDWSRVVVSNCHSKQHLRTTLLGAETWVYAHVTHTTVKILPNTKFTLQASTHPAWLDPSWLHQPGPLCFV